MNRTLKGVGLRALAPTLFLALASACASEVGNDQTDSSVDSADSSGAAAATDDAFEARFALVADAVGPEIAEQIVLREAGLAEPAYELSLPNGNQVTWYEVLPGLVHASETVSPDSRPAVSRELKQLSSSDLYRALTGAESTPPALRELDARQAEFAPTYERLNQIEVPPELDARTRFREEAIADEVAREASVAPRDSVGQLQQAVVDDSACPWGTLSEAAGCNGGQGIERVLHPFMTNFYRQYLDDMLVAWGGACPYRGGIRYFVHYQTWSSWTKVVEVRLRNRVHENRLASHLLADGRPGPHHHRRVRRRWLPHLHGGRLIGSP